MTGLLNHPWQKIVLHLFWQYNVLVSVSIILIMGVVRYLMLVEETNMVEAIKGVHKGFTKVKASGNRSKITRTTLIRQPQRLAGKIERDRCARHMINIRSYRPTYDLRSSCWVWSALTTSVKILLYRPAAWLIRAKVYTRVLNVYKHREIDWQEISHAFWLGDFSF